MGLETLGCLGITQALGASASVRTWGRASIPQLVRAGTLGPTWTSPISEHG